MTLDAFTRAYVECALWSSTDESDEQGGEPLDKNYGMADIDHDTRIQMEIDCDNFQREHWDTIKYCLTQAGHDFWLSRNGHGSGFFDGCWLELGDKLHEAAKAFGEFNLYVGDDGKIHGMKG